MTGSLDINNPVSIGTVQCGQGQPLTVIAGPCVIEDQPATLQIAQQLASDLSDLPVQLVFKASCDKANRTSIESYRGPGMERGLEILSEVHRQTGLPVTTDIHEPHQAAPAAEVCHLLQIPAFLARQTDLLVAAARTGKPVHVKKGQFLAPADMRHVISKLADAGCADVLLCERGTFFGYGQLVNDMRALPQMKELGTPVIFDATHSVQQPGNMDGSTGGQSEMVEPLARAAVAIGVDGIFLETHPEPGRSPSDGANMVPLDEIGSLLSRLIRIRDAAQGGAE